MSELAFLVCGRIEQIPEPQGDDWRRTACVECGHDIWTTPEGREAAQSNRAMAVCIECAARLTREYPAEARTLDGGVIPGEEAADIMKKLEEAAEFAKVKADLANAPEDLRAALEGTDNFEKMKATAEMARRAMDTPGDDWGSMVVFEDSEGNTLPPFPVSKALDAGMPKELVAKQLIPAIAQACKAARVTFGISAWTLKPKKGEPLPEGSFADHPDRGESLVIIEVTADGVQRMVTAEITRDGVNPPTLGEWVPSEKPSESEGLFVDALIPTLGLIRTLQEL